MAYGLREDYQEAPWVIDQMTTTTKQRIFMSNAAGEMIQYMRSEMHIQKRYVALTKQAAKEGAQHFLDTMVPLFETPGIEVTVKAEPRHVAGRTWELDTEHTTIYFTQEEIEELEPGE